jgi:hypothetical protein
MVSQHTPECTVRCTVTSWLHTSSSSALDFLNMVWYTVLDHLQKPQQHMDTLSAYTTALQANHTGMFGQLSCCLLLLLLLLLLLGLLPSV